MKSLFYRLGIGLAGLTAFWVLGMLSANELAKSAVLMTLSILGLTGTLIIGRPRVVWLSRATLAIFLLFFLDVAIKGFLRDYFGLRPNPALVMAVVLNTHTSETHEFLVHNWRAVVRSVLAFGVLYWIAFVAERRLSRSQRNAPAAFTGRGAHITVVSMLALFVVLHFNPTMAKENPVLVWPFRYIDYHQQLAHAAAMQQSIALGMTPRSEWKVQYNGAPSRTVVWVIGESVNRFNLSLYGYPRKTTPALDAMRDELVVFKDILSSEANTMASMTKMLTPANLRQPALWMQQPTILMLAKEAGYKTIWLSNHVPNDGWVGLVAAEADERHFINHGAGRGENNLDGNLLPHVDQALADAAPKKLIVVHLLGAHLRYDMRYPQEFSQFDALDDTVSVEMKNAGRSLWIRHQRNLYDNAILYGDSVLASMIQRTANANQGDSAALLFSPDHGQEVGHTRNHAGHSVADKSGYEIPMLLWSNAAKKFSLTEKYELENRPYQTDHLNHTLLGLLDINTVFYTTKHDLLSDSFMPSQRTINGQLYRLDSALTRQ